MQCQSNVLTNVNSSVGEGLRKLARVTVDAGHPHLEGVVGVGLEGRWDDSHVLGFHKQSEAFFMIDVCAHKDFVFLKERSDKLHY